MSAVTACPYPVDPPPENLLEPVGYDGNVIAFDGKVAYHCQGGMRFSDNLTKAYEFATCKVNNTWEPPKADKEANDTEGWGQCVQSKQNCKILLW